MGFHHVAVAVRDMEATHRFYTEAMGFTLVKAVVAPTDSPDGWAKHLFYDTGGQGMIAFWELHDARFDTDRDLSLSRSFGLPSWINHLAFHAATLEELDERKQRWLDSGHDVMRIDHGFCVSVYTEDPGGTLVEWCCDTRPLTERERDDAHTALIDPQPPLEAPPTPEFFRASREPATASATATTGD